AGLAFQQQAGLVVVVIAAGDATGTGFQAQAEAFDHRFIGNHTVALIEAGGLEAGKAGLVVAEHQQVAVCAVAEVVVDALFLAQALEEVQVAFVVLGAVVALGIVAAKLEQVGIGLDAVVFEQAGDDLWHAEVLEDALVVAQGQIVQLRYQFQAITGQALTGLADGGVVDQAMQAGAVAQVQPGAVLQQAFQVQVGLFADQLQLDTVALADGFAGAEFEHLEVMLEAGQAQGEVGSVGWGKHPLSSSTFARATSNRLPA